MIEIKKIQKLKKMLQIQTVKVIITNSLDGILGVALRKEVFINENNEIVLLEPTETSEVSRNLTYSIWFDKEVKILIKESDVDGVVISVIPERVIVSGYEFSKYYKEYMDRHENFDLAAVWIMKIKNIRKIGEEYDVINEQKNCPGIRHLDKLRKVNNE